MSRAHICNIFFEKELERPSNRPLINWLRSHSITAQLQFLPLLYAAPNDIILVSDFPPNPDPRLHLLSNPPPITHIEHWAPSLAISAYAKEHNIPYTPPNWPLLQQINSKIFSFTHSPKLPGARILNNQTELNHWLKLTPGPTILKTPFGAAGNGHINPKDPNVKPLYTWPVIAEPWVERVQDFSTQWLDGKLLGFTCFENEPNGTYKGTFKGTPPTWAQDEHLKVAVPLVAKIKQMGYAGHLGIDSFIYLWEKEQRVHPIVEINGRKTMSWVSLTSGKNLRYTKAATGLLPSGFNNFQFMRNIVT